MNEARHDAVFASDVHLSDAHPATTEAFLRFIDEAVAGRTSRFYVLGDLFEYWAGDDARDEPLAARVIARLRALSDDGTAVAFMAGNRDFLIGEGFAADAGLTLLPDPFPLRIDHARILLSHGDALCTDDVDYQRFRGMVRNPAYQQAFLAKPLAERKAFIAGIRTESESSKQGKAMAIMDVNDGAVGALLAAHPDTVLLHGHTHRPAHHIHQVDGTPRERWVLTDWDADANPPRGGGLALVDGRLVDLPARFA